MEQDNIHPGHNVYKEWLDHSEKADALEAQAETRALTSEEQKELQARKDEKSRIESVAVRSALFEEEN